MKKFFFLICAISIVILSSLLINESLISSSASVCYADSAQESVEDQIEDSVDDQLGDLDLGELEDILNNSQNANDLFGGKSF